MRWRRGAATAAGADEEGAAASARRCPMEAEVRANDVEAPDRLRRLCEEAADRFPDPKDGDKAVRWVEEQLRIRPSGY